MKIKKIRNKKGLTLVELLVASFVLSLMILASATVAAGHLGARSKIRGYQQKLEEMSLVLNDITKKVRMSHCDSSDGHTCECDTSGDSRLTVYSNNTGDPITYAFDDSAETLEDGDDNVILENVSGRFICDPNNINITQNNIALITIRLWESDKTNETAIQTSVSQRSNYDAE